MTAPATVGFYSTLPESAVDKAENHARLKAFYARRLL